jgi:tRNA (guanosine-2'-O-)-methyltransferase
MEYKIESHKLHDTITYLQSFVTEHKQALIEEILPKRTRHLCLVLEDIFQPHNASAVLRSAECFGVQDVHIIENKNQYRVNPKIALGASKWISMSRYNEPLHNNTVDCIQKLKADGYRIVATSPHERGYELHDFPVDQKMALMFGTEKDGLSQTALDMADDFVMIPMYGFTESFNISVSAALSVFHIVNKIHHSDIAWQLSEAEKLEVKLAWYKQIVKQSDVVIDEYLKMKKD